MLKLIESAQICINLYMASYFATLKLLPRLSFWTARIYLRKYIGPLA